MDGILDRADQPLILVVDDTPENLELMSALLMDHYRVKVASSGVKALRIAAGSQPPDLILLDIMMPEMDGYEVCRLLKVNPATADIPVVFLTAKTEVADEQQGFDLGAVDYITKPISPPIVLARVHAQLQLKASADFLRDKSEYLELEVRRRTRDIQRLQEVTIEAMASLAAMRDNPCSRHLARVEPYMTALAKALAYQQPDLAAELGAERCAQLGKSALLHGIGKLVLPDRILLSPVPLQGADLQLLHRHAEAGRDALLAAEAKLGNSTDFLRDARDIVYSQHEHWDGSGYPEGLRGEQIPLAARLMALVGCYEELTSRHPYRQPVNHPEALAQISAASGTRFDPSVVLAFIEVEQDFAGIAMRLADDAASINCELQRLDDSLGESIELTLPPS
ncbi:two-component system response regulator [Pseudomonas alcaligenes]|uniref:Two-component system response regulator n=1 Tax=Aquipseudomonas alcaligenes TaxID=43263 RepID=A0ABR7RYH4_AQUAC|nr:HD domain-containing phosphohydrolase [Pseudomonas alcaligenes]MBC9249527.1 two-component system response regulator [Pseudomonas alcaligenes]